MEQRIIALRPGEKNKKIQKSKLWFNVFFSFKLLHEKKYQCSKLNTYLVTAFLSEWG